MQRRLGAREIWVIFADSKRAFDSIPHNALWRKIARTSVSSKITKWIKGLHDLATALVKSRNAVSNKFEVTKGVLQRETLSPQLFILYIADFEKFFRGKGLTSLNMNGLHDLLMLLYANDTVILAHSHADLQCKLKALDEYCGINGLTVNATKTNIVVFRNGDKTKKLDNKFTRYQDTELEIVPMYNYLDIPLSGLAAAKAAINKARMATGVTLTILARAKCDTRDSYHKLYDSMVTSTVLYTFFAWELRYRDFIQTTQTNFCKRLLYLSRNTPSWALRIELGLIKIAYKSMKLPFDWHIMILDVDKETLPKICMKRVQQLSINGISHHKINWAIQSKEFLQKVDAVDLWGNTNPRT